MKGGSVIDPMARKGGSIIDPIGQWLAFAAVVVLLLAVASPIGADTGYTPAQQTTCWISRFVGSQKTAVLNKDAHPWGYPSLKYPFQPPGGYNVKAFEARYGFDGTKRAWCVAEGANKLEYRTVEALRTLCMQGRWGGVRDCDPTWEEVIDAIATREAPGLVASALSGQPPKLCPCPPGFTPGPNSTGRLENRLIPATERTFCLETPDGHSGEVMASSNGQFSLQGPCGKIVVTAGKCKDIK